MLEYPDVIFKDIPRILAQIQEKYQIPGHSWSGQMGVNGLSIRVVDGAPVQQCVEIFEITVAKNGVAVPGEVIARISIMALLSHLAYLGRIESPLAAMVEAVNDIRPK